MAELGPAIHDIASRYDATNSLKGCRTGDDNVV